MSALVNTFCQRQENQHRNPLQPTTVVVQSFGIGQWLKLRLAEQAGIAANIDCILPAELIWRLYRIFLPDVQLPHESPFSRQLLTWRIMQLLPECGIEANNNPVESKIFSPVQQYLHGKDDDQLRLYQLSDAIAGLFDQYLVYRPDWILNWQEGQLEASSPAEKWQSILWQKILQSPGLEPTQHRASLHQKFMTRVQNLTAAPTELSSTLSIFGLSSLPQMHLQALQAVGTLINIDIYFLNPCEHYWGDIVAPKDLAKHSIRQLIKADGPLLEEDYLEVGNPLLASFGKQGREFLELLLDNDTLAVKEYFTRNEDSPANTLTTIKNDILALESGSPLENSTPLKRASENSSTDDQSLQIHCCHSRRRELEVLFNQLMSMLAQNSGLRPTDIMIMAPDISEYAALIPAVFQNHIYYSITDRPLAQESTILASFELILNLPRSRLTSTEVVDLLEVPAIQDKFSFADTDLEKIIFWIKESGIRWEMDGASKQSNWGLPASEHNTWGFGLRRLIMGMAMQQPTDESPMYASILPFEVEPADSQLIGRLCTFIDLVDSFRTRLAKPQTASEWQRTITALLDEFFLPSNDDEYALSYIHKALDKLQQQTRSCDYQTTLSHPLVHHWLNEQLAAESQSRGFISGGITFATLLPMRSVPFKVICLLGMNDNEFPRQDKPFGFDLMAADYRKGDRSKRNDDRYLFLEALISASEYFYLSYIGRSLKDNKPKPASVLVLELQDYLQTIYGKSFEIEHPLQPFDKKYYDPEQPAYSSYDSNWYRALIAEPGESQFQDIELSPAAEVPLSHSQQLTDFFRHPAKYYFHQLGVFLETEDFDLMDTESFQLDALERYQLADTALGILVAQQSIAAWKTRILADGVLIDGMLGEQNLQTEIVKAHTVYEKLTQLITTEAQNISCSLTINGHAIDAEIRCFNGQPINYQTGTLRERQLLTIWIKHLFMNAAGHRTESQMLSTQPTKKTATGQKTIKAVQTTLLPMEAELANDTLEQLALLYDQGLKKPLLFLPATSKVFFDQLAVTQNIQLAQEKTLQAFIQGQNLAGTEATDSYYNRVFSFPEDFSERFSEIATIVYAPLMAHLQVAEK